MDKSNTGGISLPFFFFFSSYHSFSWFWFQSAASNSLSRTSQRSQTCLSSLSASNHMSTTDWCFLLSFLSFLINRASVHLVSSFWKPSCAGRCCSTSRWVCVLILNSNRNLPVRKTLLEPLPLLQIQQTPWQPQLVALELITWMLITLPRSWRCARLLLITNLLSRTCKEIKLLSCFGDIFFKGTTH